LWLVLPSLANGFARREAFQHLHSLAEVVESQEVVDRLMGRSELEIMFADVDASRQSGASYAVLNTGRVKILRGWHEAPALSGNTYTDPAII
jgi:hypothetical protein